MSADQQHKTLDSQKSETDLKSKLAFYEREHENFQNKLLAQRQSYEQEIAVLKGKLESSAGHQKSESGVNVTMTSISAAELTKENEELKSKNKKLEEKI